MHRSTAVTLAIAAVSIFPMSAKAQARIEGPSGIYSIEAPVGWSQMTAKDPNTVVLESPDGLAHGFVTASVQQSQGTVEQGIEPWIEALELSNSHALSVDGLPCIGMDSAQNEVHLLACKITVRLTAGPRAVLFTLVMSSSSSVADETSMSDVFGQLVHGVQWGRDVGP